MVDSCPYIHIDRTAFDSLPQMTRLDYTPLLPLEYISTYLLDWLVPQPLLGKAATLAANLTAAESNWVDLQASWWVLPLLVGWSGLTGWQELRRRQALRQVDASKAQLARAQAENAELRQKLVHREECIMNLSHELRNPLNQVIGEAELALQNNGLSRMDLRRVLRALRRLAWRIDCIERYYQLTDGQWTSFPETVAIETWLRGQVESLDLGELSVRVDFSVAIDNPDHIHQAELNAGDLRTVLRHLVHNAIRFTTEGTIDVKFRLSAQELVLEVRDTGRGFQVSSMETRDLAFFQADRSRTKEQQGLGMGLAICFQLAHQVGGHLEIQSTIGQGTVARFSLPLAGAQMQPPLKQPAVDMALPWILVVDDDPANQEFMADVCRRHGWAVDVAWNGEEALKRVRVKYYDVILMDGAMPKMDGFEATRRIRQLQSTESRQSTIVATTGLTSPQDQQQFWAAGVNSFVTKPVDPREVVSLIRMHLGR